MLPPSPVNEVPLTLRAELAAYTAPPCWPALSANDEALTSSEPSQTLTPPPGPSESLPVTATWDRLTDVS